jgi:hypothetical protein
LLFNIEKYADLISPIYGGNSPLTKIMEFSTVFSEERTGILVSIGL